MISCVCCAAAMVESGGKSLLGRFFWKVIGSCFFGGFHKLLHLELVAIWFILLSTRLSYSYSTSELVDQGGALIEFLSFINDSKHQITDWDKSLDGAPCFGWSYVICTNGNVISLELASKGFSGIISSSVTKLKFLAKLDLRDNDLSGSLPDFFGDMLSLESLDLANNKFSGFIPKSWGQLSNLKLLDLSSNNLTGRIPIQFFSASAFNFTGTHLACGSSFAYPCASGSPFPVSSSLTKLKIVTTSASCGVLVLLLLGAIFACRCYQARNLKHEIFVDVEGEDDRKISFGQLRRFSWREIQLATGNFSEGNVIGKGGSGKVYKGFLSDNTMVAIKRLAHCYGPSEEAAFLREVEVISVALHKNILRLIGFCTTTAERMLVYPFMQNLSVATQLRDLKSGQKGLDWPTRKRVALGAAQGLEYLHEHCIPKIIHCDIKAANIFLDNNFEAVLGDFGLAKLVDTKLTHVTTKVGGTLGHIAPEYFSTGKFSEKTDVFGYGITLLELVTGKRATDLACLEEEDVLPLDHMKKLLRENRLNGIVDGNLKVYDPKEVETVVQVALLCTQSSPEDRPTMAEVVKMLEGVDLAAERSTVCEQRDQIKMSRQFLWANGQLDQIRMSHQFLWANGSSIDQEAIQLSSPR